MPKTESASRPYSRPTKSRAKSRKKLKSRALSAYDDNEIGEGSIYYGLNEGGSFADSSAQKERELRALLDRIDSDRQGRGGKFKGVK